MLSNEIINTIPFFIGLQPATLQAIARASKMLYYQQGTVIYDSQQDEQSFIYIVKGWVKLHRVSFEGKEIITDILTDQHHFNEHLLFNEKSNFFSAQALSELQVVISPISILKHWLYQDQQLAINLLKKSLQKQQQLTHEIEHLSLQSAAQRIGCFLLRLFNQQKTKEIILHLPYDKSLLATRLGMCPETFSRALAKLVKHCKIEVSGETIYIPSPAQLVNYVCRHCSLIFPCQELIKKPG